MITPRAAFLIATFALLTGCAVLRIDVDVYKGPLANHEKVQVQQLSAMAIGAKPILTQLRDQLEWNDPHIRKCVRLTSKAWVKEGKKFTSEDKLDRERNLKRCELGFGKRPNDKKLAAEMDWFNDSFKMGEIKYNSGPMHRKYLRDELALRVNAVLSLYDDLPTKVFTFPGSDEFGAATRRYLSKIPVFTKIWNLNSRRDQKIWQDIVALATNLTMEERAALLGSVDI